MPGFERPTRRWSIEKLRLHCRVIQQPDHANMMTCPQLRARLNRYYDLTDSFQYLQECVRELGAEKAKDRATIRRMGLKIHNMRQRLDTADPTQLQLLHLYTWLRGKAARNNRTAKIALGLMPSDRAARRITKSGQYPRLPWVPDFRHRLQQMEQRGLRKYTSAVNNGRTFVRGRW